MKVTFGVYDHSTNEIDLVRSEVMGSRPSSYEWEQAAEHAKRTIVNRKDLAELSAEGRFSITFVLKGWAEFEKRAPSELR